MAFTDAEKTDIRRFCGYPAFGNTASQGFGFRYTTRYGQLEYILGSLLAVEEAVVRTTYLTNLALLETDIVGARVNLDTAQASVWTHNKNEQSDRERLFASWRLKLCSFMGVSPGPELEGVGSLQMVV